MSLSKKFIQHPAEVDMTYFQHLKFALNLSLRFFVMSWCSLIHALFPFLFTMFSSTKVRELNNVFNQRYHGGEK